MSTLLKICKEELGTYFGKKSEYGVGVTAPSQKIAWGLKMCQEEEPTSIQFWSDLSNGFNQFKDKQWKKDYKIYQLVYNG